MNGSSIETAIPYFKKNKIKYSEGTYIKYTNGVIAKIQKGGMHKIVTADKSHKSIISGYYATSTGLIGNKNNLISIGLKK